MVREKKKRENMLNQMNYFGYSFLMSRLFQEEICYFPPLNFEVWNFARIEDTPFHDSFISRNDSHPGD